MTRYGASHPICLDPASGRGRGIYVRNKFPSRAQSDSSNLFTCSSSHPTILYRALGRYSEAHRVSQGDEDAKLDVASRAWGSIFNRSHTAPLCSDSCASTRRYQTWWVSLPVIDDR